MLFCEEEHVDTTTFIFFSPKDTNTMARLLHCRMTLEQIQSTGDAFQLMQWEKQCDDFLQTHFHWVGENGKEEVQRQWEHVLELRDAIALQKCRLTRTYSRKAAATQEEQQHQMSQLSNWFCYVLYRLDCLEKEVTWLRKQVAMTTTVQ